MFELKSLDAADKRELYRGLLEQAKALLRGETDPVANAANLSALIFHQVPALNWAGFYFYRGGELVVGPFQGHPACVRIALGRGVCGTAAQERRTVVVAEGERSDAVVEGSPEVGDSLRRSRGILRLGPRRASLRMTPKPVLARARIICSRNENYFASFNLFGPAATTSGGQPSA